MIQRFERHSPQEMLNISKQELLPHFQQLAEIHYESLTSSESADMIISMINQLSHPNIGIQLINHTLTEAEFPYQVQYDMIFQKAENFYLQSIFQDLNRIRNDEPIMQISKEEIRQCVEELNWKINLEQSSVLNKSQQVGENIDLMKFFEGVRNYQNWNENIKRDCLEKLKEKAHSIQLQLTLKKGFITSKIETIITQAVQRSQIGIFDLAKRKNSYEKGINALSRMVHRRQSQSLDTIKLQSQVASEKIHELQYILTMYHKKKMITDLRKMGLIHKQKKTNYEKLCCLLMELKRKKETLLKVMSFRQMNVKPMIRASKITEGTSYLIQAIEKVAVRNILKKLDIPVKTIFQNLNKGYYERMTFSFSILKNNNIEALLNKPNVSDRIKGKILLSLDKHQTEPISLKKTFDKWYLNTHQEKYSKKVYNIWLQGNISKFTFFMRLKNMCDLVNKQMISKEMKNFIKVLCEKYGKYENHTQKTMLIRWVENVRRIRKIENMFNLLTDITYQTKEIFEKFAVEKVLSFCKKRQIVKKYLNKYLISFVQKRKTALQRWFKVNNIKKEWGKKKMRKILLNITHEMETTAKETINIFKNNLIEGQLKKLRQSTRIINLDTYYLSSFFQMWRLNQTIDKGEEKLLVKTVLNSKTKSLSQIAATNAKVTSSNIKDILFKFKRHKEIKVKKQEALKNKFVKVIKDNEDNLLKETVNIMTEFWREGKIKKDRLVTQLVHRNFVKEKLAFSMLRFKSEKINDILKIQKCQRLYEIMQGKIKENLKLFNKKLFVIKVLQKIIVNRTSNIGLALDFWKAMPLRMRWGLRQKVLQMNNTIKKLSIQRLNICQKEFINCLVTGKTKKKQGVYIMVNQFETVVRKNFRKYHGNTLKLKQSHQNDLVDKMFQNITLQSKDNFKVMMKATPEWPLKNKAIELFITHLQKRKRNFFFEWKKNSQAITYSNQIKNQKKKRVLQNLNQLLQKADFHRTRKTIEIIDKNRRIHNLQLNFLKKLCEGQAGKLLKGFMIWKSMPTVKNKQKIVSATTFSANIHQLLIRNMRFPIKVFMEYRKQGMQKRYQAMNRLVSSKCSEIGNAFHQWLLHKRLILFNLKNSKVEASFNAIVKAQGMSYNMFFTGEQTQNKIRALEIIDNWWGEKKRDCIRSWYKNTVNLKMRDIQRKHVLTSLNDLKEREERKRILNEAIAQFKANRQARLQAKKQRKVQSIIRILENQEAFKRTLLNQTVDKLKYNHYRGNFLKNQAFHKFLREKIGQVHSCLSIWNSLAMKEKQMHMQRIVTTNYDNINQLVTNAFKLVFSRGKENMIKKNTLDKLFAIQEMKFKGYFNLWRQRVKELNILGEMDKQAKASILQRINKIVNATSTNTVVETIKKFHMNFKIQKVQRKFMDRLLQTKSGKVIHAFNSWKTIPYNQKMGKFKKYQKFYFDLESFYKRRLKTVHSAFADSQDDGNLMKKQSILKLFEMTSLGIRRFYNRWTRLTKERHTLMQVHKTFKTFESVQEALSVQYQIIFQDQRAYKIKIAAINKLIEASKGTTQNYFSIWRQNVRLINLERSMDKQNKKLALGIFNKVIGNSSTGQVISIINKFKKNASMTKIAKNFFNRLMQTKTGKVIKFFEKLKTVPDAKLNKRKKKGIIFESRLHHLVQQRLRFGITPFKDSTYDANIKKKYCIDRLMRACMGQNKKKFLIWRNVVREGKILKHTDLCQRIFSNIENTYKNNFMVINKNTSIEIQKKKGLCRKLINNSLFVQHHAYMVWKEAYHIDDIKIKMKQNNTQSHLRNLFEIFREHQNKKTVQTIDVFRRVLETETLVQNNYYKDYMNQKCLQFYNVLKTRELTHKNVLIAALKANKAQAALGDKSQQMLNVFQTILKVTQTNIEYLFNTKDQTRLITSILSKIYQNQENNMRAGISLWKMKHAALSYQQQKSRDKKKDALLKLASLIQEEKDNHIKDVIKQFSSNFKVRSLKKKFCLKFFMAKSQKYRSSFMNWKKLPYQQAKKTKAKAVKFEKQLLNFMTNRLKEVNDQLKQQGLLGRRKKINAARLMYRARISQMYRVFFNWRKNVNEDNVKNKIISLDKVFSITQSAFISNFSIFEDSKIQDQRKIRALTHLFSNNVSKLLGVFMIWRKQTRNLKLQEFENCMRPFIPEDFNKKLMKDSFMMIHKIAEIQTMKGYINSLWKWKMSNIQATYYSKFIKVFKQSQQMVKLSVILNKRYYQHVHTGFRSILATGSQRQNRKKQIVLKYLTKRLRSYFYAFKDQTLSTQINVWRSKYTESIKSKILYDVLLSVFNREKFEPFSKIKGYYQYTQKISKLEEIFRILKDRKTQIGFEKIKSNDYTTLVKISSNIISNLSKLTLQQSFGMIKYYDKLKQFQMIVAGTMEKNLIQKGFNSIKSRKEKSIKSRLAIILLETLLTQKRKELIKKAIQGFSRNKRQAMGSQRISKLLGSKYQSSTKLFFENGLKLLNLNRLLMRFKRGQAIQRILQKQDESLKKNYLNRMRKKSNVWMQLAMRKFATRASIRSSPAIVFWRLKTYMMNN